MKKAIICIMFFSLAFLFAYAETEKMVTVGLYYGKSAPKEVTLHYEGQDITISGADIPKEGLIFSQSGLIKVNNISYKGSIIIKKDSDGNMTVINEVNADDYISSVIAKEMSPSFETEALKAQAVCARTYAIASVGRHSMFDVCATEHCQVYAGASCEDEKTAEVARQTKGEILTYNGKPIQTVYFAASGGYTESAKYIWGSDTPYLAAVPDKYESENCYLHRWTKELSPSCISEIMESKGYGIGAVQSIEILEQTPNGTVYKLKVTGNLGEKVFENETCRTLFGGLLPSQAYSLSKSGDISIATYCGAANLNGVFMLSAGGLSCHESDKLYIKGSAGNFVLTRDGGGNFIFSGRGNGHLVGMSQNGANGMALAGFTYDEILTHYYSGTEILKVED